MKKKLLITGAVVALLTIVFVVFLVFKNSSTPLEASITFATNEDEEAFRKIIGKPNEKLYGEDIIAFTKLSDFFLLTLFDDYPDSPIEEVHGDVLIRFTPAVEYTEDRAIRIPKTVMENLQHVSGKEYVFRPYFNYMLEYYADDTAEDILKADDVLETLNTDSQKNIDESVLKIVEWFSTSGKNLMQEEWALLSAEEVAAYRY